MLGSNPDGRMQSDQMQQGRDRAPMPPRDNPQNDRNRSGQNQGGQNQGSQNYDYEDENQG
jgi:hypothetical protein